MAAARDRTSEGSNVQILGCMPPSGTRALLKRGRVVGSAVCALVVLGTAGCAREQPIVVVRPVVSPSRVTPAPAPTRSPQPKRVKPAPAPRVVKRAQLGRSSPVRLRIASIGVDSRLMALGLRADGTMQVPPGGFPAGWYTGGPTPGELGPAVIAGHIDTHGPGVFYRLRSVRPGDQIRVARADGETPVFRVTRVARFPKNQFPTRQVYGNLNHAALRLITCGGTFNSRSGHYEDNLVVFADLVTPGA